MHDGAPAIHGRWRTADPTADPATGPTPTKTPGDSADPGDNIGVYAVHMALMRTGRVLMFSGGWESSDLLHRSWSWDPTAPIPGALGRWFMPEFDEATPPHTGAPTTSDDPDIDLFCCHTVFLPDGRLLAVGGDGAGTHDNVGLHVYDPVAESWSKIAGRSAPALPGETYPTGMVAGRWYPTAVVLADGSVAVFSGDSPGPIVVDAEILRPPNYLPTVITGGRRVTGGSERALFMYPGMHLVRGGRVFYMPTSFQYGGSETQILEQTGPTASFRMTGATEGAWQDYFNPGDPAQPIIPVSRFREEGTSVLLPPAQAGRIMLIGGGWWDGSAQHGDNRSCEILDTQAATPSWSPAGEMHHARINVNALLLPDGKVLIIGGHDRYKWGPHTWDSTLKEHAQEEAEIYDPSVAFDPGNPSAAFTRVASMHAPRTYHSTAVLLPDGSVLVAGGSDPHEPSQTPPRDTDEKHMEIYEPPYFHQGQRPVIDAISDTGGPADQIHYGGQFTVQYQVEAGATIASVLLMRPSASTHHTNTEQRHVPLNFTPSSANTLEVQVLSDSSVAPPGYYMIFLVDSNGRPCQRASFVRLSTEHCTVVPDRSHFSILEVEAAAIGGVSEIAPSFYLLIDGYTPSQLGITTTTPTAPQLAAFAPTFAFTDPGGGTVANIAAFPTQMLLQVSGASLDVPQRVTFEYGTRFTGTAMFPAAGASPESRIVRMSVNVQGHGCTNDFTLFRQPNPYMLDGATSWLSADLRVFALRPGESQSGRTLSLATPDPLTYLSQFVTACDGAPPSLTHLFDQIATDQQDSRLYLSTLREGEPVFNFAIARVRYRSLSTPAPDVRVFFRLFTTSVTSMAYSLDTYPRNAAETLPTLGQSATDILTIPCFGVSRDSVEATGDTVNTKEVPGNATGNEVHRYFGVWLDFNQTTPRYTDPDDGVLKSIQDLIRGRHQCLVAEIRFGPDAIELGETPADNDNLAQRNLAIVESDNPGPEDSHLLLHTFDLRTTWPPKRHKANEPIEFVVAGTGQHAHTHPAEQDELMIQWGGVPEDAEVTLYLPALDADAILGAAALRSAPQHLERVDAHTIRCRVSDVSYIPLPAPAPMHIAGLITIRLPESVKTGQRFRVVVRQLGGFPRHVVGTFELFISVSTSEAIRPEEERTLAVLKHIGGTIRPTSRWYSIFQRYLAGAEDKVRGVGGSPGQIEPSPTGEPTRPDATGEKARRCCRLSWLVVVLTALSVVTAALVDLTTGRWAFVLVALALAVAFVVWAGLCRVSACKRLMTLAIGATLGVGIVGALFLLGALGAYAIWLLALGATLAAVLLVLALACACSKKDKDGCCSQEAGL
jgi:galactose oxidase-like protein